MKNYRNVLSREMTFWLALWDLLVWRDWTAEAQELKHGNQEWGYYRNPGETHSLDLVIRVEMVKSGGILSYFECTHIRNFWQSGIGGGRNRQVKDNAEIFILKQWMREADRGASVEGRSRRSIRFPSGDGEYIIGYYNLQWIYDISLSH